MSPRRRLVLFATTLAPLLAAAAVLSGGGAEDESARSPGMGPTQAERASAAEFRARAAEQIARAESRLQVEAARREDPRGEPGPRPEALRLLKRARAEVEPVARRFFAAFSLYELGRLDHAVARELRATATPVFAGELLSARPRLPAGASKPERAFLGRLEFVPGEPDASGRRLVSGELVGVVQRGAGEDTIAIELRRSGRGWRVSGLGR